ncbi:hypothetical protein ACQP00_48660 [Dactylosporangium sp. CS-047395]|uniref:hypothetical protein n=1 Tax=Dactylosporangium sp. CS-047395 TaxID=3239936 RepID=UPI003D8C31EF
MGDTFEVLVDVEATPGEAPALAEAVLRWLAAAGIVEATRSDAALGTDRGHRPGPNHRTILRDPDHLSDIVVGHLGFRFWNWPPLQAPGIHRAPGRLSPTSGGSADPAG